MESYLIIGGGPGGYELAAEAANKGHKVTLVERDRLGGTCLNRGCIPTKAMVHAVDILREVREGADCGIDCGEIKVDYQRLCERRDAVVDQLRQGVEALLGAVEIVRGEARFVGPKTVEVTAADGSVSELTADRVVIATGSVPSCPPIPGAETALTSDGLLRIDSVPESMVIIGGGVIGLEFASIFSELGSHVTVIEYCREILPQFDKDIAKRLRTTIASPNLEFVNGAAVTEINGREVVYEQKGRRQSVEADAVVMAVGRRPALPEGLAAAGIETDGRAIKVDPATMLTSAEGVYAIGDVNGICMLAHAASAQGRRVLGIDVNLNVVPSVVFTHPELAMVGATEQSLKEAGADYKTSKALFRGNGKAVSMGETSGLVKLIYSPATRQILGCSIMGPHASDMIGEIALAMSAGLPLEAISRTIHPHPALCEAIAAASAVQG